MNRMKRVRGREIGARDFPSFTWNADLIELEGPLLSLYQKEDGSDALFAWLDCDARRSRWAVVPIGRTELQQYLQGTLSLRSVFEQADHLYVFSVGSKARKSGLLLLPKPNWLPDSYLPSADSFLTADLATDAAKRLATEKPADYSLGLDGELYIDDIGTIPRLYQQLYSFHYGLEHLSREAVREKLGQMLKTWRGGINAVNIFTGLKSVTPSIHRAKIRELQYASPGFIKLNLLESLAGEISRSVATITSPRSYQSLEDLYGDVYGYFRDQKISGFDDERKTTAANLSAEQKRRLKEYVKKFFALMHWQSYADEFRSLDPNPLGQLRILLAYYRRLRRLREFVVDGRLSVPPPKDNT